MIAFLVPDDAYRVLDVCMAHYRIHSMNGMDGWGARFVSDWKRERDDRLTWLRHRGFEISWGMRPVGVERGGFIALTAIWERQRQAKAWRFRGWGTSYNFPLHTSQRGPGAWRSVDRGQRLPMLLEQLQGPLADQFVAYECNGSQCSHKDPTILDGDVLVEPGLTTSKGTLFARVW